MALEKINVKKTTSNKINSTPANGRIVYTTVKPTCNKYINKKSINSDS